MTCDRYQTKLLFVKIKKVLKKNLDSLEFMGFELILRHSIAAVGHEKAYLTTELSGTIIVKD